MLKRIETALMTMERPSQFFVSLAMQERAPLAALYDLIGVEQNHKYHPEGDAFVHTMMVVDEAAAVRDQAERPFAFMLAALTHDLGKKPSTKFNEEKGTWQAIGHERTGRGIVRRMLNTLGADEETVDYCVNMCAMHMRVHTCFYGKAGTKATNRLFRESVCPQDLVLLSLCDSRGKGTPTEDTIPEETYITDRLKKYMASCAAREDGGETHADI
ncbi:MAG: HD domain-containing protein [Clostridia bacterium]|nr:HD domain-containing protein [Clostridia bacterium]